MALLYFFSFFALCMNVEYGPLKVVIENLFRAHYTFILSLLRSFLYICNFVLIDLFLFLIHILEYPMRNEDSFTFIKELLF